MPLYWRQLAHHLADLALQLLVAVAVDDVVDLLARKLPPSDGGSLAKEMTPGSPPNSLGVSSLVICIWLRSRSSQGLSTEKADADIDRIGPLQAGRHHGEHGLEISGIALADLLHR